MDWIGSLYEKSVIFMMKKYLDEKNVNNFYKVDYNQL